MGAVTLALWFALLATLSVPLWWRQAPGAGVRIFVIVRSWPEAVLLPLAQAALIAAVLYWVVPAGALFQRWLAASLLGPSPRSGLTRRIEQLTETRADALAAHGAELRRIERDLHDGAQAQLVSALLRLGLADSRFDQDPNAAHRLLRQAQDGVEEALAQLRTAVRGIYPPILADRGLAGAVRSLAAGQSIPVSVELPTEDLRAPAAVEAAAYFVIAEALTNVARHSGAAHARVVLRGGGATLEIEVCDDGRGGADPSAGSGLTGIRRRVAALDGSTSVESRPDAGTRIEVSFPCGS